MAEDNFVEEFLNNNNPTGWFEVLYAKANGNPENVPWQNNQAHPVFLSWLDKNPLVGDGKRALVIGCGLGNDAELLAELGFEVTAFDISPTAIEWCQQRFPNSSVDYQVSDLFNPPQMWLAHFDFVLEIYTIQALPPDIQQKAAEAVTRYLAPKGHLFVVAILREETDPLSGPPWPLTKTSFDQFQQLGLHPVSFEIEEKTGFSRHAKALYQA
ncbi:MAG: class I SAM-dependent methyltransferase [Chloroflexota bacterium]